MDQTRLSNFLTVIIPTFNEEIHLGRALQSFKVLNIDCFIVDSNSTDRTIEIAKSFGCQVFRGDWNSFSEKINWSLNNLPIKTTWVMRLDADEQFTEQLIKELAVNLPRMPEEISGIWINRRLMHLGRWMKYGACYPNKSLRILKYGKASMEPRLADEKVLLNGPSSYINADIIDEPLKGMVSWTAKHLMYAEYESMMNIERVLLKDLNELDKLDRYKRYVQQNIYYRLPLFLRPFLYWFYRYFIRLGFLDGKEGFVFHFLQAFWYRFFVDVLIFERRIRKIEPIFAKKI